MAAYVLRLGRFGSLKGLHLESCGVLRRCPSAAFATNTKEPKKTGKKAKAPIVEGATEQVPLLAYRTSGAFSSKVSFLEAPQAQALGGSRVKARAASTAAGSEGANHAKEPKVPAPPGTEAVNSAPSSVTPPAEPEDPNAEEASVTVTSTAETGTSQSGATVDEGESSSSSTSSDSDSDSDSDNEKEEVKTKMERSNDAAAEGSSQQDKNVTATFDAGSGGSPELPPKITQMSTPDVKLGAQARLPAAAAIHVISEAAPKIAPAEAALESSENTAAQLKEDQDIVMMKQTPELSTKPVTAAHEVTPGPVSQAQPAAEAADAVKTEEMMDPAPVLTSAPGEELQPEAFTEPKVVDSPEEAAEPPAEPEPEPFDNSTYKNLQHHQYHMYTFTDLEVEMAKYRLPQPSSGRPSPRH
ncbi:NADH dehydrogenase ubiquinone flavoprotein 3, mitochondrial [Arapaima gigas]